MAVLKTNDLKVAYAEATILHDLNITIPAGRITALVGSNGCGKTTLLRVLARLLKPTKGAALLDGEEIARLPTRTVARRLGILPQSPIAPDGMTVRELVAQGRYPYQSWRQQWSREDEQMVAKALQTMHLDDLADRLLDSLSGGQRQRAWIAMTLAQNTEILLLDEPTTYLDLAHQIEILDLVDELNEQENRTIVMVLHDINQACRYAHHLIVLKQGQVLAAGSPSEILDAKLMEEAFGVACHIVPDPVTGTPLCLPYMRRMKVESAESKVG
jgi:iron complex transport system ATP-binding protein